MELKNLTIEIEARKEELAEQIMAKSKLKDEIKSIKTQGEEAEKTFKK